METEQARKTFLILEDDADDALLIRRAFTNSVCRAFVCRNTSEARAYLNGAGMYADRSRFTFPEVFVTDLRLGEETGVQFVKWLRQNEELRTLPVIVLAGTVSAEDVHALKGLGVARMLEKPGDPFRLERLLLELARQLCGERSGKYFRARQFASATKR